MPRTLDPMPRRLARTKMTLELGFAWCTVSEITFTVSTLYPQYEGGTFETAVFPETSRVIIEPLNRTYSTREDALAGHRAMVAFLFACIDKSATLTDFFKRLNQESLDTAAT